MRAGGARAWLRLAAVLLGLLGVGLVVDGGAEARTSEGSPDPPVLVTTLGEPITPVIADHIADGVAEAEDENYGLYLIELDTPGGLDSSMRDIVQTILSAEVPVAVFVAPPGGRAASAGAVITLASHAAVMAPGTTIGSATPVSLDGAEVNDKVVEDAAAYSEELARLRARDVEFAEAMVRDGVSLTAEEAVEREVVEGLAGSREEALDLLDGTVVTLADGEEVELATADSLVDEHDLGLARRILQWLSDPNVALILLSLGTLGILYELAAPGIGAAGFVGAASLLVGLFSLAVLPVSAVGIVFLVVAAGLFVGELFAPGVGILAALGTASLVLAGVFLLSEDDPSVEVSLFTLVPVAVVMFLAVVVAGRLALRARTAPPTEERRFHGSVARVRLTGDVPQVFVEGAWWRARRSDGGRLDDDDLVQVDHLDELVLVVDPIDAPDPVSRGGAP